jgi:molecular chaperone DnaK
MSRDNRTLGKFHLTGIPAAPRGVPQIEVTFDIDANGILNVSAKDTATGKSQNITITASSGLGKDEVDRMVKEAQAHADDDKKRRELVDARNQADAAAYEVEKLAKDNREKLGEAEARALEEAAAEARKIAEGDDVAAIQNALSRLQEKSRAAAESLYKSTGAQAERPGAGQTASEKADDVVDAEYTVKN